MAGRRQEQRERMRERLLGAALELFEAQGYDGTTIDQIAARADVARQTVLNHYPQKHDFIEAWGVRRRALTLAPEGEPGAPDEASASLDPVEALHTAFDRLAEVNVRERVLTRAIREQLIVPQPVPQGFTRAVELGREQGAFRTALADAAVAEVFAALYFDTVQRWLAVEKPPFDLAAEFRARVDLVLAGLRAQ